MSAYPFGESFPWEEWIRIFGSLGIEFKTEQIELPGGHSIQVQYFHHIVKGKHIRCVVVIDDPSEMVMPSVLLANLPKTPN